MDKDIKAIQNFKERTAVSTNNVGTIGYIPYAKKRTSTPHTKVTSKWILSLGRKCAPVRL